MGAASKDAQRMAVREAYKCIPNPVEPDSKMLIGVGIILALLLCTATLEAYALRMRHIIAGYMYPARRKSRAAWLYSYILATRGNLAQFTRRRLRQKLRGNDAEGEVTILQRICYSNAILSKIYEFMFGRNIYCVQCGKTGPKEGTENFQKCPNLGCVGIYCRRCVLELETPCVVCDSPVNYGDPNDVEEEVDSSEDDVDLSGEEEGF